MRLKIRIPQSKKPKIGSPGEELLAFQLKARCIQFAQEWQFDAKRKWRVDFVIYRSLASKSLLAVEIEGGAYSQGRHTRGSGFVKDIEKYNALTLAGWRLLRFTPEMVKSGVALQQIEEALK